MVHSHVDGTRWQRRSSARSDRLHSDPVRIKPCRTAVVDCRAHHEQGRALDGRSARITGSAAGQVGGLLLQQPPAQQRVYRLQDLMTPSMAAAASEAVDLGAPRTPASAKPWLPPGVIVQPTALAWPRGGPVPSAAVHLQPPAELGDPEPSMSSCSNLRWVSAGITPVPSPF